MKGFNGVKPLRRMPLGHPRPCPSLAPPYRRLASPPLFTLFVPGFPYRWHPAPPRHKCHAIKTPSSTALPVRTHSGIAATTANHAAVARCPTNPPPVVTATRFIAGPTIKKTNAAPAESPFHISDAAIGIAAVEHTYIGIPTAAISGNNTQSLPPSVPAKKSSGTAI